MEDQEDILLQIKTAYDENIRPLINIKDIDIKKIASLMKQLNYKITGNEDILVKKNYDKQANKILDNFNEVFQKMKTSDDVYELFKEMEDKQEMSFLDLSEEEKMSFSKSIQNPVLKLEVLNTILIGVFCSLCLDSAGFDLEF